MKAEDQDRSNVFQRAWEIINQDTSIADEEKEGVLKLIQVLIEVAEASPYPKDKNNQIKTFTQEIISKHSLMVLVKQQADELDALKSISRNIISSLDLQTVLDTVVTEGMRLVKDAQDTHIYLYSNGMLEFGASLHVDGGRNKPFSDPRRDGLTYTVARSGEAMIIEDIAQHPIYKDAPKAWTGSIISIPLKFNNSIVGVMNLARTMPGSYTRAELRLINLLADQAALAISHASLHQEVAALANTDSLTGLPNRRALDERLQEDMRYARRMKSQFAVVMMDLDGFKNVNDTMGHAFGDDLLRSVFSYLAEKMRPTDFLARYGGDELTLIMRDSGLDQAQIVTKKIIEMMKLFSYPLPGKRPIVLGITAGIAVYPNHSRSAADLLRAADTALYQAKKHFRGSYSVARGVTGPLDPLTVRSLSED